jgi:hypothetical protein
MSKQELDNLVGINKLKREPASLAEFDGMLRSARTRLVDAQNESIDADSQFDLAYGAAHRLASAALRQHGYGSEGRITVFFKRTFTLSGRTGPTCKCSCERTTSVTWRNTKADQRLINSS